MHSGAVVVSKAEKDAEIRKLGRTDYLKFIKVNEVVCDKAFSPYKELDKKLAVTMGHIKQGRIILENLNTAVVNLNSMIESQDKLSLIDRTFNSILDNELALAKKHYLDEREEKPLEFLPNLDFQDDRNLINEASQAVEEFKPATFTDRNTEQAYNSIKELIPKVTGTISTIEAPYNETKALLSKHIQGLEEVRKLLTILQNNIMKLCNAEIEAKNISTASTETNTPSSSRSRNSDPKLSNHKDALHGNNSKSIQDLRKKQQERMSNNTSSTCCIVM